MQSTIVGIDIAKNVYQVVVSPEYGKQTESLRMRRSKLLEWLSQREQSVVAMEACGSAHWLARKVGEMGHEALLIPPKKVKERGGVHKTDAADAYQITLAARDEKVRPVPVKSAEQLGLQGLEKLRVAWVKTRTQRYNFLRATLREHGVVIPLGSHRVVPAVHEHLEKLPSVLRPSLLEACEEVGQLNARVHEAKRTLTRRAKEDPECCLLTTIEGVGPLIATAAVTSLQTPHRFASGRHVSAFVGIVPKETSSGEKRRYGQITKSGNRHLRTLLVHGARSLLRAAQLTKNPSALQRWALALLSRKGHNKTVVALANRLCRAIWVVWTQGREWQRERPAH